MSDSGLEMPPKKQPVKSSTGSTSSKPVNAKSSTAKSNSQQLFHGKKTGKAATAANKKVPLKEPSKPSDAKAKKTNVTQDELAAIKIQCFMRKTLARKELGRRKKEKEDYEELIEKLQRQVSVLIVLFPISERLCHMVQFGVSFHLIIFTHKPSSPEGPCKSIESFS